MRERHQVSTVAGDEHDVVIDRTFIPLRRPTQGVPGTRSGNAQAIVNACLDLRAFLIIVPGNELQGRQLLSRIVKAVDLRKSLQPGLPALLTHDPIRSPGHKGIVESFVCRPDGLFIREGYPGVVEVCEITDSVVRRGRHYPRITAFTQDVREPIFVLE